MYDYVTTKPELNENTLLHYGVKGMRWRNKRSIASNNSNLATLAINNKRYKDEEASKKAKTYYESRKSDVKLARGNARKTYGKKILGILGYKKSYNNSHGIKKSNTNKILKTIVKRTDGNWDIYDTNIHKTKRTNHH